MKIFTEAKELQSFVAHERSIGHTIGFVPTMGALHAGHLSLVERARAECDVCIVSIFVNPTQFNDPKDLQTYPRTFEQDRALLEPIVGAGAVFHPSVQTMYPEPDKRVFDVGDIAQVMEGKYRPGHFNGVMQVVSKLFEIVYPDVAFFGEKDFQQIAVIRAMCKVIDSRVKIMSCPIVRETDGLAMSSRNIRLTPEQRSMAPNIYRILSESRLLKASVSPQELTAHVIRQINSIPTLRVEYYEIVDADSLKRINSWDETARPYGCITVFCGEVRLIDNISYA